jgi:hypothetical protein
MSNPPNLCVYCGRAGVTKEHFWGAWSRKYAFVKNSRSEHTIDRFLNGDLNIVELSKKGHLQRPGSNRSQTMKIACRECNGGWMKSNLDSAIPILKRLHDGYWGHVTEPEAAILVRWIAQFTMSYEFADRETVMIPQAIRTEFAMRNSLSGHWVAAIGIATPATGSEPVHHRAISLRHPDGREEPMQVTVLMFGRLIAMSVYSAFPTPNTVFTAISEMSLAIIHPPGSVVLRPSWGHNEETVPLVVQAVSNAFSKWIDATELS